MGVHFLLIIYDFFSRFALKIQETDPNDMKPVFTENGVSYVYIQHNNIYVVAITRKNSNVMTILVYLEKLVQVSGPIDFLFLCFHFSNEVGSCVSLVRPSSSLCPEHHLDWPRHNL